MAAPITKCQSRGFICLRRISRVFSTHLNQKNNKHSEASDRKTTHFGFETVTEEEKEEKVYEVFKNVAEKYDLMNDAMSVGVHRLWKDHFIRRMAPLPGTKLLDVAGGTGDIAFRFLNYVKSRDDNSPQDVFTDLSSSSESSDENGLPSHNLRSHDCHVTVCDINQSMLEVGQGRAAEAGITSGGRFMCLEFSEVPNSLIRSVYDEYSFQVIPVLGQVLASDWSSYQYLVENFGNKLEKQDSDLSQVEIDEMLGLVGDVAAEVSANNCVPGWVVLFVKFLLDEGGNVLLNVVLLKGLGRAVYSILLHLF
ncbi:COQ5-like protein [Mya arenaria]|uniref:COQ5-like protein n=1 Tax=Mya arenaria TaxID=6604 RepID=A0ABY7E3F2_MYAAR|nr:COQ5-like protein [Mya arenaria]